MKTMEDWILFWMIGHSTITICYKKWTNTFNFGHTALTAAKTSNDER